MDKGISTLLEVKEIGMDKKEMIVHSKDSPIGFIYPPKGQGDYFKVREFIFQDKLLTPTFAETISLIYAAWKNPTNEFSKEILNLLNRRLLWVYTGNLYIPNKGVYIQHNPNIKSGELDMEESDLEKKMKEGDATIRFVNFGFEIKELTKEEIYNHPYIMAMAGKEGAEKLAEIRELYGQFYLFSFRNVNKVMKTVSTIYSSQEKILFMSGANLGINRGGYSFGISEAI